MFGLLSPRSPLSTAQRVDIELLLRRNVEVVGASLIRDSEPLTSIDDWRLDEWRGLDRAAAAAEKVLQRMPPAVTACDLAARSAEDLGFLSTYSPSEQDQPARITLSDETLADPRRLVIELAYQYATHFWHLVTDGRPLDTHPRTTNLLPICCGMGVIASDACLYDMNWSQAGWSGWSISRSGYYNAEEIGYALALLCRTRNETRPSWVKQLRLDSKVAFDKAQRFFAVQHRSGIPLLFDADRIPNTRCDPRELADWLSGEDPAFAYAAAAALVQRTQLPPSVAESAIAASQRNDSDLAPSAMRVLGNLRASNPSVQSHIERAIGKGDPRLQLAALQSASALGLELEPYQRFIARLLDEREIDPMPLLDVIQAEGKTMAPLAAKICQLLAQAIREKDETWRDALVACLRSISDDPQAVIEKSIRPVKHRHEALQLVATP